MTTIWEKLAHVWRVRKPSEIDIEKLANEISGHLDKVQKTIEKGKSVPSAMDAIFGDDDNSDDDW